MKILHVCYNNGGGGADIAASRIHRALIQEGLDSTFLCCRVSQNLPKCICIYGKTKLFINKVKNQIVVNGLKILKSNSNAINIFSSGIYKIINKQDADIIHLHFVCSEMLSIEEIAKINKPIIWTMPDLWACMGSNSYYHSQKIPMIKNYEYTYKSHRFFPDVDVWCWKRKKTSWKNLNIYPVAVSDWMLSSIKNSQLFKGLKVTKISYCLDPSIFNITSKQNSRKKLKLPMDKFIILAGGSGNTISRKGFDLLEKALLEINMDDNIELVVFGEKTGRTQIAGLKTHWLGIIKEEYSLAEIFNAADVMCVPSRQESFCQTAAEALACGTPVVAFGATGLLDIVDHKINGFLAEPYNHIDFAAGIKWILNLKNRKMKKEQHSSLNERQRITYSELCGNARKKAVQSFSFKKVAHQYEELYEKIISKSI